VILADTSIWVDHFRRGDPELSRFLELGEVLIHPFLLGELWLGNAPGAPQLVTLGRLPLVTVATHEEVMTLIDAERLSGRGIGYVDAHLIAAARLTPDTVLWTRDGRLHRAAADLRVAYGL
jgi:predicted nucleic acid-binding protein